MSNDLSLAALLCSRVCHDLLSPVSALNNGLEVLAEDDDPEMREQAISLIAASGRQASVKLQFARLAFGASAFAADQLAFTEAQRILNDLFGIGKVKTEWIHADRTVDKSLIKILMNLAIIAGDSIPRGGTLLFDCSHIGGREVRIVARGDRARLNDDVRVALSGARGLSELDARSIQPFMTGMLARHDGFKIEPQVENDCIIFELVHAVKSQ